MRESMLKLFQITESSVSRHHYHKRLLQTRDKRSSKYSVNDVNETWRIRGEVFSLADTNVICSSRKEIMINDYLYGTSVYCDHLRFQCERMGQTYIYTRRRYVCSFDVVSYTYYTFMFLKLDYYRILNIICEMHHRLHYQIRNVIK